VVFDAPMNPTTSVGTSRKDSTICDQVPDIVTFRTSHNHDDTMIVFADHRMRATVADIPNSVKPQTPGFCVGSNVWLIHHLTKSGIHSELRRWNFVIGHDSSAWRNRNWNTVWRWESGLPDASNSTRIAKTVKACSAERRWQFDPRAQI